MMFAGKFDMIQSIGQTAITLRNVQRQLQSPRPISKTIR